MLCCYDTIICMIRPRITVVTLLGFTAGRVSICTRVLDTLLQNNNKFSCNHYHLFCSILPTNLDRLNTTVFRIQKKIGTTQCADVALVRQLQRPMLTHSPSTGWGNIALTHDSRGSLPVRSQRHNQIYAIVMFCFEQQKILEIFWWRNWLFHSNNLLFFLIPYLVVDTAND